MPALYHNGMSTCSQKVRLALAEKGVAFQSFEINLMAGEQKQPAFLELNPRGVVPVLKDGAHVIVESSVIMEYVHEAFEGPDLMPRAPADRAAVRDRLRTVDVHLHSAVGALLGATAQRAFQLMQPEEDVLAAIARTSDPTERAVRLSLFRGGVDAPEVANSLELIGRVLDKADADLAQRHWLVGDFATLADCALYPYCLRLDHLGLHELWRDGGRPNLEGWMKRFAARDSASTAVGDWLANGPLALIGAAGQQILPLLAQRRSA